ncbi:MAG: CHAD domain-containing protein [Anaerolineae bacterium]|nr:CHAD domain-containing protein [Anaerolineae bacterium]
MEIEAKFAVPNREAYRALLRLRTLAGYALIPTASAQVADRYFDTADGRLLAAGYACRLRSEGASALATLKGLGGAQGALHHRDEQEVQLTAWTPEVAAWPPSPARDLALALSRGAPLQPLFDLEQRRTRADVVDGSRRVAELSLDAVRAVIGRRPALYYELEVELKAEGTEEDLARLAQALSTEYGLKPEPRSKFERALETLRRRGAAIDGRLSAEERAALEAHARGTDAELARRAAVVLGWADGLPTREIVARTGLSAGRVRFWVRTFRASRMNIFAGPEETTEEKARQTRGPRRPRREATRMPEAQTTPEAEALPTPRPDRPVSAEQPVAAPVEQPAVKPVGMTPPAPVPHGLLTVADFCRAHGVDMAHASYVAEQALFLFDALAAVHGLPRKRRKLLRQAALLCTVGAQEDAERPHRGGRDLILAEPLQGVSTAERLMLASIVGLQRAKPKPEKEPTLEALTAKQRAHAISLAALLQVAEALDSSRTQSTRIVSLEGGDSAHCEIVLAGQAAGLDARQAASRSGWWQRLHKQELVFTPLQPLPEQTASAETKAETGTTPPAQPPAIEIPPLRADEPMSEAGRKILYTHFLRMLANEAGTRLGEDIEALHDMRVASRRMRAAYRIFEAHFDPKVIKPFNKSLRQTGQTLGAVRDLDVLLERAEAYRDTLSPEQADALSPLLDDWRAQREVARRALLDYLDGSAYRRFVDEFRVFLSTPGAGARTVPPGEPVPYQVCHVAPRLIMERYEQVRAYEPVLRDGAPLPTYHMLRIDCKRLRYALEFFRPVLGPETPDLIKQVTAMQDLLGALQDAHVAEGLIQAFLAEQQDERGKSLSQGTLAAVEDYLAEQRNRQQALLAQFPVPWSELIGADFRRALALAVAAL